MYFLGAFSSIFGWLNINPQHDDCLYPRNEAGIECRNTFWDNFDPGLESRINLFLIIGCVAVSGFYVYSKNWIRQRKTGR